MPRKKTRVLTASTIALINVAAICNIKNFPLLAEFGLSIVFLLALAAIIYFIPAAFVSAELASGWPDRGVYTWVREALGPRIGFVAVWLQWIENVIYYPTILSFIAAALAFTINPSLASNKFFVIAVILVTFWVATIVNFFGMKISGLISFITALFGTIIPVILITGLAGFWIIQGLPSQIEFSWKALSPQFSSFKDLVLFSGVLFGLAGVEMSAVHAKDVENPKIAYPKGIFLSAILILIFSTIGALAIGVIVPCHEIELASGAMEAFQALLNAFNLSWTMPIVAAVVSFGALGMLSTWIVGPSRGLYATALHGDLPPLFHTINKKGMPIGILIAQGIIVTILSLVFFFMPSVNSSYWILLSLAALLYQLMYVLMFISAIVLRYTHPHVNRGYKIPFGNVGIWVVSVLGIMGSLFGFALCFIPPGQFSVGNIYFFEFFLIGSAIVFCLIPLLIYKLRKPSWILKEESKTST
jgi:putative glutamate/gamma-aminobutyrate antiporter